MCECAPFGVSSVGVARNVWEKTSQQNRKLSGSSRFILTLIFVESWRLLTTGVRLQLFEVTFLGVKHHAKKQYEGQGGNISGIFNPGARLKRRTPGTRWITGWVASRSGVDSTEKRKILHRAIQSTTAEQGLGVGVPGYRSRGSGFDSRRYRIFLDVVGLERGPLSLVRITEELLEWKSSDSGLENRD
jgi:hypothetical protein